MTILLLCREHDPLDLGYVRGFLKRNVRVVFAERNFPPNGHIQALLDACPEKPFLVLHPETELLPWGLDEIDIPTACFQNDTCAYTHRRLRWAMLFDYPLLFVPGFEERFELAGHPRPVTIPYAVEVEPFREVPKERPLEIGWVGRLDGPLYASRRRLIPQLASQFRMNEWRRRYPYEEMAELFKSAKVVINVSRDDYPEAANLRVFEAMAAGALLITRIPTDLTVLGFREGEHFVGYRSEDEVPELVRYYLCRDGDRSRIREAAREVVMREHTYDCRVEQLLNLVRGDAGRLFAPARSWSEEEVRFIYLDYYSASLRQDCAWKEWKHLARRSPGKALLGISFIGKAAARQGWTKLATRISATHG